jgi:hypothetical protein
VQLQQTLVALEIAGTACRVECDDRFFAARLGQRYAAFASGRSPELAIDVKLTQPPGSDVVAAWSGPYARVVARPDGLSVEGVGFTARFDQTTGRAVITQPADPEPLETLLTAIYASRLLAHGGFFIHAATIVGKSGALVFFGPSGSGKTTVTELVGDGVLTDEISAIRSADQGFLVSSVPWRGQPGSAPLAGLFRLRQATTTGVRLLTAHEAIRELLPSVFFARADAGEFGRFLETAERLVRVVPVYELAFQRDRSFWSVVPGAA